MRLLRVCVEHAVKHQRGRTLDGSPAKVMSACGDVLDGVGQHGADSRTGDIRKHYEAVPTDIQVQAAPQHVPCHAPCSLLMPCHVSCAAYKRVDTALSAQLHLVTSKCCCHSVTELPPGVEHLELQYCDVEGLVLPAQRQLRSIRLRCCNPEHGGATFALQSGRAAIDLLAWLAAARPGAAVQVSDSQLALGRLSMERCAERLSEAAPHSVDIRACTLHGRDGRLSRRVADMARYMGRRFGRRVAVACPASKNSCRIERMYKGQ